MDVLEAQHIVQGTEKSRDLFIDAKECIGLQRTFLPCYRPLLAAARTVLLAVSQVVTRFALIFFRPFT